MRQVSQIPCTDKYAPAELVLLSMNQLKVYVCASLGSFWVTDAA